MVLAAFNMTDFWHGLVIVGFLAVCLVMVLTVLIQKPQGGGLSGAFGSGAGSGQTAFGTKTGDALTIFTIIVFVVYLIFAVALNFTTRPDTAPPAGTTAEKAPAGKPDTTPAGAQPDSPAAPATSPATDPANPPVGPVEKKPDAPASTSPAPTPATTPPTTPPATPPPGSPAPADPGTPPASPTTPPGL